MKNLIKKIILCADDYGQTVAISQAIIELLRKNRLSATTCLTTSPEWDTHAAWLAPFQGKAGIGLHFNLTEGTPLSSEFKQAYGANFPSLSSLLVRAYLGRLNQQVIECEFYAQLDRFHAALGVLPNFIDGHQHIHQFPIIRDAILAAYENKLRQSGVYIRSVNGKYNFLKIKQLIIQLCGAHVFKNKLIKKNIPHNSSFSGIYNFSDSIQYANIFPGFLDQIQDGGLIMCHPGLETSRCYEFDYFNSEKFIQDCEQRGVKIENGI